MEKTGRSLSFAKMAGAYLKRSIKANGMTQESFAEKFGCDERTVRRWISQGIGSTDTIEYVLDFFGDDVRDLFLGEEEVPSRIFTGKSGKILSAGAY